MTGPHNRTCGARAVLCGIPVGEVVILDTADAWKIHEAYETGQYEGVLRVLSVKCSTPCSHSSLSHAHRSMGFFRNQTFTLAAADSPRPIDYTIIL